jgi:hypothetical protein
MPRVYTFPPAPGLTPTTRIPLVLLSSGNDPESHLFTLSQLEQYLIDQGWTKTGDSPQVIGVKSTDDLPGTGAESVLYLVADDGSGKESIYVWNDGATEYRQIGGGANQTHKGGKEILTESNLSVAVKYDGALPTLQRIGPGEYQIDVAVAALIGSVALLIPATADVTNGGNLTFFISHPGAGDIYKGGVDYLDGNGRPVNRDQFGIYHNIVYQNDVTRYIFSNIGAITTRLDIPLGL